MPNKSKIPETNNKGGSKITRREFSSRVAALGMSTAFAGTIELHRDLHGPRVVLRIQDALAGG